VPQTHALTAQLTHFLDVLNGAAPLIDASDARRTLAVTLEVEAQIGVFENAASLGCGAGAVQEIG
jgi:hypothetical protein